MSKVLVAGKDGLISWKMTLVAGLAMIVLSGCASTRVDFGGVMSPQPVPADAKSCDDAGWHIVERVRPVVPMDLVRFFYLRQDKSQSTPLRFSFDVDEGGSTANIRFLEPEAYTRHATLRKAILASAEAIEQWRFETDGRAVHATGCSVQMDFMYQMGTEY